MTVHQLRIPAPDKFLNSNQRLHWAARAKLVRSWRGAGLVYARRAKLPKGLERVHIRADIHKSGNRKYDASNMQPTLKALIDGIVVDYGLCADDDNDHVEGPDIRRGEPGRAAITLTITELTPQ